MASNMERSRVILKAPLIAPGGGHRTSLIDRLCSRQVRPANRYAGLAAAGCAVIIAGFHTADSVRPCPPPVRGALQQGESLFESRKPRAPMSRRSAIQIRSTCQARMGRFLKRINGAHSHKKRMETL